jgi:hypothetical protein
MPVVPGQHFNASAEDQRKLAMVIVVGLLARPVPLGSLDLRPSAAFEEAIARPRHASAAVPGNVLVARTFGSDQSHQSQSVFHLCH